MNSQIPLSVSTKIWGLNQPAVENNNDVASFIHKMESFTNAYSYFQNLALSIFTIEGLDEYDLDESFILRNLFINGSICFTNDTNVGLVCGKYAVDSWDWQHRPNSWKLIPVNDNAKIGVSELQAKALNKDNSVIVYLNKAKYGLENDFTYYARLNAMLRQLYENNVFIKSIQGILEGKNANSVNDLNEIINNIYNQNSFIKITTEGGVTAQELLHFVNSGVEFMGATIDQALTSLNNQMYLRLGVNHIAYEKKARLNVEEVKTNDQALDLIRYNMFETLQNGFNKVNELFGTNFVVKFTLDKYLPADMVVTGGEIQTEREDINDNDIQE